MATKKATKTAAKTTPAAAKKATKAPTKTAAKTAAEESKPAKKHVTHEEVAKLAEQLWIERGRPEGSAHVDWHHAEQKLKG